ncbi:MAG: class I SAM-dependent methyltransferase, partial [Calditrichales bacterium]
MNKFSQKMEKLIQMQQKPEPFTQGEPLFWNDPHISAHMLAAHLDPTMDRASRRPHIIDQSINLIINTLGLSAGDRLLDLGCGPGLYAVRFAGLGLQVTGVDYSQRSIDYAVQYARENQLDIAYRYQNYLELDETNCYDAALLIFGDFCPLAPAQRQ